MENEYHHITIPIDFNLHKQAKEGLTYKLKNYTAKLTNGHKRLYEKNRKLQTTVQKNGGRVDVKSKSPEGATSKIFLKEIFNT